MRKALSDELFERIERLVSGDAIDNQAFSLTLHEVFRLVCEAGLKDEKQTFGNLFSMVNYLCRRLRISGRDTAAIQKARRDCHHSALLSDNEMRMDCRAVCLLIAKAFHTTVPSVVTERLNTVSHALKAAGSPAIRHIRGMVKHFDSSRITVTIDGNEACEEVTADYSAAHLRHLESILSVDMQLNLLYCTVKEGVLTPQIIIVEPDFLIDISSIAQCFTDYGHHPLAFTVNRLARKKTSQPILLGGFASAALDDIIHKGRQYNWQDTFRSYYADNILEFCSCGDFNQKEDFKQASESQSRHIEQIVGYLFDSHDTLYSREKALLEPSFVCEGLGLQGRIDLMTTDMKLLVEQKSGKNYNLQTHRTNRYGSYQKEEHYVQLLLYHGMLQHNFMLSANEIDTRLLYSKYPLPDGLVPVAPYHKLFQEAIALRNRIVKQELDFAEHGFGGYISCLTPATLNERQCATRLFTGYQLPRLQEITAPLHRLNPLERAYFTTMMTFVYREQLAAKVGTKSSESSCDADLWNMPLSEKQETGNIYTRLRMVKKEKTESGNGFDRLTLSIPQQTENFNSNFRRGDMVYLYAYRQGEEPDVRRAILHRGTLVEVASDHLTVHLQNGQQNPLVFPDTCYAVEHSGSTTGFTSSIRALYQFICAAEDRRRLLLMQREPRQDTALQPARSYHPDYDGIVAAARKATDYYLIVGAPGTGKTSMAMRFLVEDELAHIDGDSETARKAILLTAYTNRAVDEICGMLVSAGLSFMRIGSEHSCDPRYKEYLFSHITARYGRMDDHRQCIERTPIIVGTTSAIQAKSYLFDIKKFSLIIVDEAGQILEPSIIGILSASDARFVLIGDHKQMPAVVQQPAQSAVINDALLNDIGIHDCRNSLFERLLKHEYRRVGSPFLGILHKQGRMHPAISGWTNDAFYRREKLDIVPLKHQIGNVIYPESACEKACSPLEKLLLTQRMIFIDAKNDGRQSVSDKANTAEAVLVVKILGIIMQYYGTHFDPEKTVGVIVPYRNQIALIRQEIDKSGLTALKDISIDTIERYQGSQREVIIYSFTVQHGYQLGFLTANSIIEDGLVIDRKLNVALTRARRQMIMIGQSEILGQNAVFSQLIDHIKHIGGYL